MFSLDLFFFAPSPQTYSAFGRNKVKCFKQHVDLRVVNGVAGGGGGGKGETELMRSITKS